MLDLRGQEQALIETVGPLRCDVNLPSAWEESLSQTGRLPGKYSDRRRYPRYHFGGCAALQYRQTFPALPRPEAWYKVFSNDISRGGLSFLHGEPLFPRERMLIVLPPQLVRAIEVVSYVRVQERCFRVGARFIEQSSVTGCSEGQGGPDPAALPLPGRSGSDAPQKDESAGLHKEG
jgi:hypothetical protein